MKQQYDNVSNRVLIYVFFFLPACGQASEVFYLLNELLYTKQRGGSGK